MQIRCEVLNIEGSFRPRGRHVQDDSVARYELAWFQSEYQGICVNVSEMVIHDRTAYTFPAALPESLHNGRKNELNPHLISKLCMTLNIKLRLRGFSTLYLRDGLFSHRPYTT